MQLKWAGTDIAMEIFYELLYYVRVGDEGPGVSRLLERYGRATVVQMAITFLAWLQRYGTGIERPLELKAETSSEKLVYDIVTAGEFSEALEVKGYEVDFRSNIPIEDRREIAEFVASNHRPEDWLVDR